MAETILPVVHIIVLVWGGAALVALAVWVFAAWESLR